MLKVEYPCGKLLSSYQSQTKPVITWSEAKKHLHDVRLRRQQQLTTNIDQCHKLYQIHKQIFHRQLNGEPAEKLPDPKPIRAVINDPPKKLPIPRIEYASTIYRQADPTFEVETLSKLENDIPIVRELTKHLSGPSRAIVDVQTTNNPSSLSIKKDQQRRLSVSSVSSTDKRANKVYEKWPDYHGISEIVGYRIDPPPPKVITSNSVLSRPSGAMGQRKRNVTTGFSAASKQIKNIVTFNSSPTRRDLSKSRKSTKTNATPITVDHSITVIEKLPLPKPIQEVKPKLPTPLCPSSMMYSNRIRTRQWLVNNQFSVNATHTLPLI